MSGTSTVRRLNFTIPEGTAEKLHALVEKRGRSSFVTAAIREKLDQLERERLKALLDEGYTLRAKEGADINAEWEPSTLEGWR